MRVLLVPLVILALVGCQDEGGLKKKVDQLERRVEALERGGRRHAGRREGRGHAEAAPVEGPKGKVDVTGDATRVALMKDGARFDVPGEVPVGSYTVLARFGDERVEAGSLEVADGDALTLNCTAATKSCAKP